MIRPRDSVVYPLPLIRRAMAQDLTAIVAIEKESFSDPWGMPVFLEALSFFSHHVFCCRMRRDGSRLCRGRP